MSVIGGDDVKECDSGRGGRKPTVRQESRVEVAICSVRRKAGGGPFLVARSLEGPTVSFRSDYGGLAICRNYVQRCGGGCERCEGVILFG